MSQSDRMVVKAYVCEGGVVRRATDEGSVEFREVFIRRPDGCRYAVVEANGQYLSIDLFDTKMSKDSLTVFMGEHKAFETYEAAVMASRLSD